MTFHLPPPWRRGLAALALAILAGAGAPLANALVQAAPPPQPEIAHSLTIACPVLNREPGDRPTPWLGRCGLPH